ncbi:MAG: hypothetical protein R6V56_07695 [Lentisphaeria bacterium]
MINRILQFTFRTFNPRFLLAAGLLLAGLLTQGLLTAGWADLLRKKEIPLQRSLNTLPHEFGPYTLLEEIKLSEGIVGSLGTENYISWIMRDKRKSPGSPGSAFRVHTVYYTGNQEAVSAAHVPEICYVAGGYKRVDLKETILELENPVIWTLREPGSAHPPAREISKIPIREFVYVLPQGADEGSVIYFFIYNGKLVDSRNDITLDFLNHNSKYRYYCKVEINPGSLLSTPGRGKQFKPGTFSRQKTHRLTAEFMQLFLPELQQCLPDIQEYINQRSENNDKF